MSKKNEILECLLENGFREERCGTKCSDGKCKHYGICKMFVKLMKKRLTGIGVELMKLAKIERVLGGNGCDKCDEIDGDYYKTVFENGQQLKWNRKRKKFVCPRGHVESFEQAMRNETRESLYEKLKKIAITLGE